MKKVCRCCAANDKKSEMDCGSDNLVSIRFKGMLCRTYLLHTLY